jgi:hypothetical protein
VVQTLDTLENQQKKWWKRLIHSKINQQSDKIAWYTQKSTKTMMKTLDTLEILISDLANPDGFLKVTWRKCDRGTRSQMKFSSVWCVCITFFGDFRMYHAFRLLCLWIFECIIICHYFLWVASQKVMKKHDTLENSQKKWLKSMIHSKINNKSYENAWYTRNFDQRPCKSWWVFKGHMTKVW